MKKVLIVSYYYSPANMMGAVRASKLSKYLQRNDYEVQIICSESNKLLFMPGELKVDSLLEKDTSKLEKNVVIHSKIYKKIASWLLVVAKKIYSENKVTTNTQKSDEKKEFINILKRKVIHFSLFIFSMIQDFDFLHQAKKHIKKNNLEKDFEVVISTYGPLASHLVGKYIKKIKPEVMWIADFRDPIAQPTNNFIEFQINKLLEKKISELSDKVIAVSKGYLNEITNFSTTHKTQVITNGFDVEDYLLNSKTVQSSLFSFVYTGTTYGGKRDLKPIFSALKELIDEKKINKDMVVFKYAGSETNEVHHQASEFGLEGIVEAMNFIPRSEALDLQAKSHILVVSTWNESKHEGVLPGKFLEYMMFKKPILAIVNGSIKNSEIKGIIDDYKIGCCYESINKSYDFIKLKQFIYDQYVSFIQYGSIHYEGDLSKVNNHNYENITKKFIDIIEEGEIKINKYL